MNYSRALIIGAGPGVSGCFARAFHTAGGAVHLAARTFGGLDAIVAETGATTHICDASDGAAIAALFETIESTHGAPDVVLYNPSARVPGPIADIDATAVENAVRITALGAFHAAQQAARRMVPAGRGAILLTGATAGVKGYPGSAAFAMGKFALRGLAQSLARELHPKGVHVGHFVIDGGVRNPARPERMDPPDRPDSMLAPEAVAREYMNLLAQDRSCWSWEVDIRPWTEPF